MHFAQFGVAATLAGLGSALLLPPTIHSTGNDVVNSLPFEAAAAPDRRVMEVNCPGCPVMVTDVHNRVHQVETENILRLNFSIVHGATDQLLFNGFQIYPFAPDNLKQPFAATQLVKSEDDTWQIAARPRLSFLFSTSRPVHSKQDDLNLVAIHLQVTMVGDTLARGIPSVDLKLLETPSGKLMLGDAEIAAPTRPLIAPVARPKGECTTLACKWKAIIAGPLSKLKGCGRKGRPIPHVAGPNHHGARPYSSPHGPRPHPHRPFRHHHHRHGGFARLAKTLAFHVLVPIIIGIAVGITASLVGMVAGYFVVFVWRTIRGRRPQYAPVQQDEVAEDMEAESKSFIEPPPTYEVTDDKTAQ